MANPRNLTGVEDALLMALEVQGNSAAVQILGCIRVSWLKKGGFHRRNKGLIAFHVKLVKL